MPAWRGAGSLQRGRLDFRPLQGGVNGGGVAQERWSGARSGPGAAAVLNTAMAGDAAAVKDLRHAFCFFDSDGNGTMFTTKVARPLSPRHQQAPSVAQCRHIVDG